MTDTIALPNDAEKPADVDISELSQSEMMAQMYTAVLLLQSQVAELHQRLDGYEALGRAYLNREFLTAKLQEVVKEFSANGGLMTLFGGGMFG